MKNSRITRIGGAVAIFLTAGVAAVAQTPLGTGFTYQGQLKLAGAPLNDSADLEFSLWDAAVGGNQIDTTLVAGNVTVVDGLFTLELDFGAAALNGDARWLEIAVRSPHDPGDTQPHTTLSPRQPLTAVPYAQTAVTALSASGIDGHSLDAADGDPIDAMFVDDTGNVGIGTTTPAEALDVNGNVIVRGVTETDQVQDVTHAFVHTVNTIWQSFIVGVDGSLVQVDVRVNSGSTAETGTLTVYEGRGTGGTIISSGPFTLPTGVTQWVSLPIVDQPVLQSGLEYTFSLLADAGAVQIAAGTGNPYPAGFSNINPGADLAFRTYMRQGNVGIGTITPTTALDVAGTVTAIAFVGNGAGLTNLPVMEGLWSENGPDIFFDTGNVGIGTTSPASQLHIKQNSDIASSAGLRLERPANANHWDIYTFNDDDLVFEFNDQGSGGWAFIRDQDLAFAITSDRRAKKDIQPLTDGLDKVLALRPVTFRYKRNDAATPTAIGMIAQEVEAILPELVDEKEGMKTLSYQSFGVLAIKAIQEQQAIIEGIQCQLTEKDTQIDTLRAEMLAQRAVKDAEVATLRAAVRAAADHGRER